MTSLERKIQGYMHFSESLKNGSGSDTTVKDTAKDSLVTEGIKLPSDNVEVKSPESVSADKGLEASVIADKDLTAKKIEVER